MSETESNTPDPGLRDQVESATVSNGYDPDAERTETIATENREMVRRSPDPKNVRTIADFNPRDRLRASIRNAISLHKAKDSGHPAFQAPVKGTDAPIGPPTTWSTEAKVGWKDLPQETRLAALKEQKTFQDAVQPVAAYAARAQEILNAVEPHRGRYAATGMSDPQAITRLFDWERALNDPITRQQAFVNLGQSLGLLPGDFGQQQQNYSQPQYEQQSTATPEQMHQAQAEQAMKKQLADFAKDHEHFSAIRYEMGLRLQTDPSPYDLGNGGTDLHRLYKDVCRSRGLYAGGDVKRAAAAAVSPSARAPSAANGADGRRGKGDNVRSSIKAAIAEARGGGRV